MSETESTSSIEEDIKATNDEHYITLTKHPDYKILDKYPFIIKNKKGHIMYVHQSEKNHAGYTYVKLNSHIIDLHRVLAEQFLPNPENLLLVNHINRDITDYHLDNLEWSTFSNNNRNRKGFGKIKYEFVKELSEDAFKVPNYETTNGTHNFDFLYFQDDNFYYYNGIEYRILHRKETNKGDFFVNFSDSDGHSTRIYFNKFKFQYDLN
ncbi:hypothetical protein FACS189472_08520 [Alphaproteobacteria bacterium]|nr:hypothetical protein FACS189472_08520 [Alphaproteobacteria bacterium]